jgi:hypothetical protein
VPNKKGTSSRCPEKFLTEGEEEEFPKRKLRKKGVLQKPQKISDSTAADPESDTWVMPGGC